MKQYIVDAFAERMFEGNPAAVCVMDSWLSDDMMQKIAKENNLSETAFAVKSGEDYDLRWFTPGGEVNLCGHATLATAYVIMHLIDQDAKELAFNTLSGILNVIKKDDLLEMDFPAYKLKRLEVTGEMTAAIGFRPLEALIDRDMLCVLENEEQVRNAMPDLEKVKELDGLLLHITATGLDYDCVSRSFAPKLDVAEDPVCGSGHCHIIPYWSERLAKDELVAFQASERGGTLYCIQERDRVKLSGKAVLFAISEIMVDV